MCIDHIACVHHTSWHFQISQAIIFWYCQNECERSVKQKRKHTLLHIGSARSRRQARAKKTHFKIANTAGQSLNYYISAVYNRILFLYLLSPKHIVDCFVCTFHRLSSNLARFRLSMKSINVKRIFDFFSPFLLLHVICRSQMLLLPVCYFFDPIISRLILFYGSLILYVWESKRANKKRSTQKHYCTLLYTFAYATCLQTRFVEQSKPRPAKF